MGVACACEWVLHVPVNGCWGERWFCFGMVPVLKEGVLVRWVVLGDRGEVQGPDPMIQRGPAPPDTQQTQRTPLRRSTAPAGRRGRAGIHFGPSPPPAQIQNDGGGEVCFKAILARDNKT
eukprot:scaffold12436_cov101-Isochrysis_galbana.AAC.1